MPVKIQKQQYMFIHSWSKRNLNKLETEMCFFLQREDRRLMKNKQELSRWIEAVKREVRILNHVHNRCKPMEVLEQKYTDTRIVYRLSAHVTITVYKSK